MSVSAERAGTATFRERFEVEVPIVGAPMAFISGGELAGAIAAAGGLGLIGGGYGDETWVVEQLALAGEERVRAGRVGVGLISWASHPDALERLAERGVRTFFLSFGDPTAYLAVAARFGARTLCQVQSVDEAVRAEALGTDALVVQGTEAGGHGRDNEQAAVLLAAVRNALPATPTPVLLAGAVSTAADVRRALGLGADGVLVGTRMYATVEALDADEAKQRLVHARREDAVRTSVFDHVRGPAWPSGYNGRALRNSLVARWKESSDDVLANLDRERADYTEAARTGDLDRRVVWAGSGVGAVDTILPAAEVVRDLARGFDPAPVQEQPGQE